MRAASNRPPSPATRPRQPVPLHAPPRARIALAHDWLCGFRGGEAVLDRIARLVLREAEPVALFVMVDDRRALSPAIDALPRVRSWLDQIPGAAQGARRWLLPIYPLAVADLSRQLARAHRRRPIDLLISTSSAAIKALRAPPGVPHLCYCFTPARYVWSQRREYARGNPARALGLALAGPPFRRWDARTAAHVDAFLTSSRYVAQQIASAYGRHATVIPPPVRTTLFCPDPTVRRESFWLVVGALEPYKRVDLAIAAARRAGRELVIVGTGSDRRRLARLAGPHVRLVGRVSDTVLVDLYRRAALLLFPQIEDFGIVAVEAQACGLPVVARRAGGALDIVRDGQTGALFDEPTVEAILDAVARVPPHCAAACRANALRFDQTRFDQAMRAQIAAMVAR